MTKGILALNKKKITTNYSTIFSLFFTTAYALLTANSFNMTINWNWVVLLLFFSLPAWASSASLSIPEKTYVNSWKGLSLVMQGRIESVSNLNGGIAPGTTATGLWLGGLALHTSEAGWWQGGLFVIEGLAADGSNPDSLYVGDLQGVSNLTTPYPHMAHLYKAFYRQRLGRYTVRLGLINPNDYFNDTGVASDLFNASYGIYPTITVNIPYTPTYPCSSLGAMVSATWGNTTILTGNTV